ncbi:TPA: hypothetical protein MDX31_002847 [Klebsiella quasipneumoniae]|nr:hypothetical protein [Klebsiella quasipneumoniae]HBT4719132.1 hypothetical protein [Klebsiella quasipneumoniae subsp. similipneumoniae]HBV4433127.1 hypothetical protein [Klebsiella quasipneumoniae]
MCFCNYMIIIDYFICGGVGIQPRFDIAPGKFKNESYSRRK